MVTDHDAALERARRLLSQPLPERTPPVRMHTPRDEGEGWDDWPASRAPTVNVGKMLDRRIRAQMDVLVDAVGHALAKRAKGMAEELAKRDAKIAELERRLSAIEGDTPVIDIRQHIKGGRDAA